MGAYHKIMSLALADASANAIAHTQTPGGAGNLTLTSTVVTLDTQRRVLLTTTADETSKTFIFNGTDLIGNVISETVTGVNNTTVGTKRDFYTITSIHVSAALAGAITVGTSGVASTIPMIVDRFINPANISCAVVVSGTINYSIEVSYDDLAPAWNVDGATLPTWFAPANTTNLTSKAANGADIIDGPITMIRLTQNSFSSGGTAAATVNIPMIFA